VPPDRDFLLNTDLENAAAPITLIQDWNLEGREWLRCDD